MTAVSVEKRYKTRGETRDILYWDPRCADAPPHARITVGNTSAHQQSHTASGRHDGWATERPQTDSLVDIDVTDISLNALQPLDNSVFPPTSPSGYGFLELDLAPTGFGRRIYIIYFLNHFLFDALIPFSDVANSGIGAFTGRKRFFEGYAYQTLKDGHLVHLYPRNSYDNIYSG